MSDQPCMDANSPSLLTGASDCSSAPMDYIGRCCECNGIVGWMAANLSRKEMAKAMANWVKHGDSIERMATDEARKSHFGHQTACSLHPSQKKTKLKKQLTLPVT